MNNQMKKFTDAELDGVVGGAVASVKTLPPAKPNTQGTNFGGGKAIMTATNHFNPGQLTGS